MLGLFPTRRLLQEAIRDRTRRRRRLEELLEEKIKRSIAFWGEMKIYKYMYNMRTIEGD